MIRIVNVNALTQDLCEAETFARYDTEYRCVMTRTAEELIDAARDAEVVLFTFSAFTGVSGTGSARTVPVLDFAADFDFDCGS